MKPSFWIRLIVVVPFTIGIWVVIATMIPIVPIAILFGEWTYKGKKWK